MCDEPIETFHVFGICTFDVCTMVLQNPDTEDEYRNHKVVYFLARLDGLDYEMSA